MPMSTNPSVCCSKHVFDVARVLCAIWVFCCHSFYPVHEWFGFFSVLVFFFISGYGMEVTFARHRALTRLPRFIAVLLFFALLYFLVTGDFVYPTAWYILAYSSVMILYRFFGSSLRVFIPLFLFYLLIYRSFGFHANWWLCPFGFLLGVLVNRFRYFFSWSFSFICFSFGCLFFVFGDLFFLLLWSPLVLRVVMTFSSLSFLSSLSLFSPLVFPFFSLHCWFLNFFDATWTLGGSTSPFYAFISFCLSLLGAAVLYVFVPIFSKKKFWIFQ